MGQIKNIKLHIVTDIKKFKSRITPRNCAEKSLKMASGGGSKSKEKTVLVATDPSEHSMRAFNWYLEHFHRSDQIIGLAHIYTHPEHHEFGRRHGNALEGIECQQHDEDVRKVEQDYVELVKKYEEICKAKGLRYREFCMERKSSVGEAMEPSRELFMGVLVNMSYIMHIPLLLLFLLRR